MQHPGNTPFDEPAIRAADPAIAAATDQGEEIGREQLSLRKRLLHWRTLVPLVIVLGFLLYTAQKLQIDPGRTWAAVRSASPGLFLAAFLTYYLSLPVRTLRWRLLLRNVGYSRESKPPLPHFGVLCEIFFISWFANVVVPAKIGDVYRAYLLRQECGVSAMRTFGTVLAERLLDLSVLLVLFFSAIIISLHANLPAFLRTGLYVALALVLVGILALFALRIWRAQIRRFIPLRFQGAYDHLQAGTLGSFKRLHLLLPLTVLIWCCEAGRFFFIALALQIIGGNLLHIGALAMFIALGEALLTIVPFTSGGIGLVEGGMLAMLALFTSANNLAAASVLLDRTISLFSILVIGLLIFLAGSARRAARKKDAGNPPRA
jgi:hypothetical protein